MHTRPIFALFACLACLLVACGGAAGPATTTAAGADPGPAGYDALPRLRFNQLAMQLNLPLYWAADADGDGAIDADEVRSLLFYSTVGDWVRDLQFTASFRQTFEQMVDASRAPPPADPRLRLVHTELGYVAPTLVENNIRAMPATHRDFARRILQVAFTIDRLYAQQVGMTALSGRVAPGDTASQSLFRRNWGAACRAPITETDPACSAIEGAPRQPVDVYPAAMQADDGFCAPIEAHADSEQLFNPFVVVREQNGELVPVPYTTAYESDMANVARALRAAADALSDPDEEPMRVYLRAAAQSFTDNDWRPADEAWSRMNASNSKWYLRVGPDEVYWDPCSRKAAFHLTLALINTDSLTWQERLTPLQGDMERALAALTPESYRARDVSFHMPDFIDITVNAGDDRDPFGATIGQSLPNWGPVSTEGRGRTVAMSNLYTDPDSLAMRQDRAATLLSAETMAVYSSDPGAGLLSTILHEAMHNLGPTRDHEVRGRVSATVFDGPLMSMLEELKAQSGALFFVDFLKQREIISETQQREVYLDSVLWALGHISRGMYTPSGRRKAYSQLAAIQVGFLLDEGAIRYAADGAAANGTDRGAFTVDFAAFHVASEKLMQRVMQILSTQDRAAAEALAVQYVDGATVPQAMIVERHRRYPRQSFVYSLTF